jgi:hypothetical protein
VTASDPELLTIHAVRLLGFAPTGRMAARFGLDREVTAELLEDHRALGWTTWSEFAGTGGWSLTDRGRAEGERRLGAELDARLTGVLDRLGGYHQRYAAALAQVERGRRSFVDGTDVDSCHTVWFQLHEDLLATLGLARGEAG